MASAFQIRPASSADIGALLAIEQASFSDPWSAQGFDEVLHAPGAIALLAEDARGRALGYLLVRTVLDECEILNLAVLPGARRGGVGRALLAQGLDEMRTREVARVYLEVRQSNGGAQSLYAAFGFRPMGVRPNYYRSPREDGLVLCLTLEATA